MSQKNLFHKQYAMMPFMKLKLKFNNLNNIPNTRIIPQLDKDGYVSSYYCLSLVLDENLRNKREEIMRKLTEKEVGTSIYYPSPVPRMKYYKEKYGYDSSKFKNAEGISDGVISFPVGPHLLPEDIDFISSSFIEIIEQLNV